MTPSIHPSVCHVQRWVYFFLGYFEEKHLPLLPNSEPHSNCSWSSSEAHINVETIADNIPSTSTWKAKIQHFFIDFCFWSVYIHTGIYFFPIFYSEKPYAFFKSDDMTAFYTEHHGQCVLYFNGTACVLGKLMFRVFSKAEQSSCSKASFHWEAEEKAIDESNHLFRWAPTRSVSVIIADNWLFLWCYDSKIHK